MSQFKKTKVVLLPAKNAQDKGQIFSSKSENKIYYSTTPIANGGSHKDHIPNHLYFLSDIIPEVGDYYYWTDLAIISKYEASDNFHPEIKKLTRKVIATTDKSLVLPRPSDKFLQKYCELGGIEEVMVEYGWHLQNAVDKNKYHYIKDQHKWATQPTKDHIDFFDGRLSLSLRVAPDNTITIKKVKDTWNAQEHLEGIYSALGFVAQKMNITIDGRLLDKWIEKNL